MCVVWVRVCAHMSGYVCRCVHVCLNAHMHVCVYQSTCACVRPTCVSVCVRSPQLRQVSVLHTGENPGLTCAALDQLCRCLLSKLCCFSESLFFTYKMCM